MSETTITATGSVSPAQPSRDPEAEFNAYAAGVCGRYTREEDCGYTYSLWSGVFFGTRGDLTTQEGGRGKNSVRLNVTPAVFRMDNLWSHNRHEIDAIVPFVSPEVGLDMGHDVDGVAASLRFRGGFTVALEGHGTLGIIGIPLIDVYAVSEHDFRSGDNLIGGGLDFLFPSPILLPSFFEYRHNLDNGGNEVSLGLRLDLVPTSALVEGHRTGYIR